MFGDVSLLPPSPIKEDLIMKYSRYCGRLCECFPEPIYKFLMMFPLLIYMFSPARRAEELELEEQEKRMNAECLSELFVLKPQVKKLQSLVDHYRMLADKFESGYNAMCMSSNDQDRKHVKTLKSLENANNIIQRLKETDTKKDEIIAKQAEIITEKGEIIAKREETITKQAETITKKIGYNNRTANACQHNTESGLASWKDGPIQNILVCSFCLGYSSASSDNESQCKDVVAIKKLQLKDMFAISLETSNTFKNHAHDEPIKLLWKEHNSWLKKKHLIAHLETYISNLIK